LPNVGVAESMAKERHQGLRSITSTGRYSDRTVWAVVDELRVRVISRASVHSESEEITMVASQWLAGRRRALGSGARLARRTKTQRRPTPRTTVADKKGHRRRTGDQPAGSCRSAIRTSGVIRVLRSMPRVVMGPSTSPDPTEARCGKHFSRSSWMKMRGFAVQGGVRVRSLEP